MNETKYKGLVIFIIILTPLVSYKALNSLMDSSWDIYATISLISTIIIFFILAYIVKKYGSKK